MRFLYLKKIVATGTVQRIFITKVLVHSILSSLNMVCSYSAITLYLNRNCAFEEGSWEGNAEWYFVDVFDFYVLCYILI